MKPKRHRGNWIVTLPLSGLAALYLLVFFLPVHGTIGRMHGAMIAKQDYVIGTGNIVSLLGKTQEQLETTRRYNAAWEETGPRQRRLSAFFGRISGLAGTAGTTITRFDPEPIESYDKIRKVPLSMGCTGTFAGICRFLRELEALPQSVWVEDMHLRKILTSSEDIQCDLVLAIFIDNLEDSD